MIKQMSKIIGLVVCCATPLQVSAAKETLSNVTVLATLADGAVYGGCMANISAPVPPESTNCPANWVTFSCDGTYNTPQAGKMKYSNAVMAFALKKKLSIQIDDTKKHDGFCYAYRVDLRN